MEEPREGVPVKIGQKSISFSFFPVPDEYGRVKILASDIYGYLYRECNQPDSRAYISQAKELALAAEVVEITAKPLLLYYSFLNLVKTLISLDKDEGSRFILSKGRPMHGIDCSLPRKRDRFGPTFDTVNIQRVPDGRISTLEKFVTCLNRGTVNEGSRPGVGSLLIRVPSVHRAYSYTRGKPESINEIRDISFSHDPDQRIVWVNMQLSKGDFPEASTSDLVRKKKFRSFFSQVKKKDEAHQPEKSFFQTRPIKYVKHPKEKLIDLARECRKAGVVTILTEHGYYYYFSNPDDAYDFDQLTAVYMLMFYLGWLARYYPRRLSDYLAGDYGWVLSEFITSEQHQFPYLMASEILRREVVKPWATMV